MSCRLLPLVPFFGLLAPAIGCSDGELRPDHGRLDVMIRPANVSASGLPLQGSFVLHGLDHPRWDRLDVTASRQTLRLPLRPGSYVLEWQPVTEPPQSPPRLAAAPVGMALAIPERSLIVIASGRVSSVNVRITSSAATEPVANAADFGASGLRVARP